MEDYLASIIFGAIDTRLLSMMIIAGFLIFFVYFYKSELWDDFSDFDKLSLSIVCGFITFIGLVVPLARIIFAMNSFISGYDLVEIETEEIISTYKQIYIFILLGLFILTSISSKPLYDNINIFKKIFVGYFIFIVILSILNVELLFAILFSQFRDYSQIINRDIFTSIYFMIAFFGIYLVVHKKSILLIYEEFNRFFIKFRLKKMHSILFLLLLILFPYLVGSVLFSYSVVETEQEFYAIYIDELPVFDPPNYISAERESIKHYTIKPSIALKWVKITPDLHLKKAYKKIDGKYYYYDINDNNYFIVNESSKTNVTAIVTEKINLSTELTISDKVLPNYDNDTDFFQITLKNNVTYIIETDFIESYIDSNYEPIQLIKNHNRTYGQYSSIWNKNDSNFNDQIFIKGNSLYLKCPPLDQNNSVEFYATLKKIDPNQ